MVGFAPSWLAALVPLCVGGVDIRAVNTCGSILFRELRYGSLFRPRGHPLSQCLHIGIFPSAVEESVLFFSLINGGLYISGLLNSFFSFDFFLDLLFWGDSDNSSFVLRQQGNKTCF